jgi:uncharacterized membrane protein
MKPIEVSVDIRAPIEETFELFTDVEKCAQYIDSVESIELLGDTPVGEGTRWRETRMMNGREATEEMWVTEFVRPNRYVVESESHGMHYTSVMKFRDVGQLTHVTMSFEAEPQRFTSRIIAAVLSPFFRKSIREALQKDLKELKAALEADAGS